MAVQAHEPQPSRHEYETKKSAYGEIADDSEQAVGLERWEYEQRAMGNQDPFGMNAVELTDGMGTKENPIIIPSYEEERIVGYTSDQMDEVIWFTIKGDGTVARGPTGEFYKLKLLPSPF